MHRIHSGFLKLAFTVGLLCCISLIVTPATAGIMDFSFAGLVDGSSAGPSFSEQVMSGDGYSATLGNSSDNFMEIQKIGSGDVYPSQSASGSPLDYFQISIIHFPSAFSKTTDPPSLGMIGAAPLRLAFGNSGPNDITTVPIPPGAILFGTGIVALICLGATNWQGNTRAKDSSFPIQHSEFKT